MDNLQLSKQQLDNMTLLDVMMNTMSAAEKLVFGQAEGKKYAYYDEGNSAEWKTLDQLKRELQIQKECLQSMIKLFEKNNKNKNYSFPSNLSKEDIIIDLKILKEEIKKMYPKKQLHLIYDDIIKLLNNSTCKNYTIDEIYDDRNDNIKKPLNEEEVDKQVKNILNMNAKIEKRDEEFEKELMENYGKFNYQAILYQTNTKLKKNNYFKNLYQNYYENMQ
jgi:hypothetical protein